jgi:cytochrome b561
MGSKTITHYSARTQVLHWLTTVVLVAFIYGPGASE